MPKKTLPDYVTEINHLCDKQEGEPGSYTLTSEAHNGQQCYSLFLQKTIDETKCVIMGLTYDQAQLYLVGMTNGLIRGFNDAMGNPAS